MTSGTTSRILRAFVALDRTDIELLLRHLKRLRQLLDELDSLDVAPSSFQQRQGVRDRLRREIDVTQAAVMSFGPIEPGSPDYH